VDLEASKKKVAALTEPRNAVVIGVSDRPGSWATRAWRNLKRYEFPGPVYLINPRREKIFDTPCYPDFKSLPEPPDHLVVVVPAPGVPELLRSGAAAGARSATVFSSGFGEAFDDKAAVLGRELKTVIAETGLAVSGPNCMGNICAKSRMVTLTEDRQLTLRQGPVALVGQSGGMLLYLNVALEERGISAEYLITSGNEAGLGIPDYVAFFADQPELKVIVLYIEGISDLEKFKAACRMARAAGKAIVAIKLGQSDAGRGAAMAHTGSLAGTMEAFDAVAADLGIIRADTLDDAVEFTEFLVHTEVPRGRRLGAVTHSGAFRGVLIEAAERNGLVFAPLAEATTARLNAILGVGSMVSNPIDGGFAVLTSHDNFRATIDALQDDPSVDMVLFQEKLPTEAGTSNRAELHFAMIEEMLVKGVPKPIAAITLTSHGQTDYSRDIRAKSPHLSFLQEANKALRGIERAVRRDELERLASAPQRVAPSAAQAAAAAEVRALATAGASALDETQSKDLLRAYGIATPTEIAVQSPDDAVKAARQTGFPVVLKAVAAKLTHKSDVGAVALHLADDDAIRAAYARIADNVRRTGIDLEAMLVCQEIAGGLELVLGLNRDPEMGLVVMAGSGGVLLELIKDVAFAAPPVTAAKARAMIERTHVARLMRGYRGGAALDIEAVVNALVALGRIAEDLADVVQSIDINPFVVLPRSGFALDALFIPRGKNGEGE
jgi:acetate---CoA ligase (ADP-forming)